MQKWAGDKNTAKAAAQIVPVAAGWTYVMVESFSEEDPLKVNRQLCKVTVKDPAKEVIMFGDTDGYLTFSDDNKAEMHMRPGSSTLLAYSVDPLNSPDREGVKWSVKGSNVSVKNGLITAKKAKYDKKGNPVPAIVKLKVGKAITTIAVYVE